MTTIFLDKLCETLGESKLLAPTVQLIRRRVTTSWLTAVSSRTCGCLARRHEQRLRSWTHSEANAAEVRTNTSLMTSRCRMWRILTIIQIEISSYSLSQYCFTWNMNDYPQLVAWIARARLFTLEYLSYCAVNCDLIYVFQKRLDKYFLRFKSKIFSLWYNNKLSHLITLNLIYTLGMVKKMVEMK